MDYPDLNRLAVFYTLVNQGTMSKASQQLFITQPAISAHIKALEQRLGVALFDRAGRGSVVSSADRVLYEKAEHLFSVADELQATMEDLRGTNGEGLDLARATCGSTICPARYTGSAGKTRRCRLPPRWRTPTR